MTGEQTGAGERMPFRMETEVIPEGVDPVLAAQRIELIQGYRDGVISAEDTMRDLLDLYWDTQHTTNGETNVYLMEASYQFPVEAGIPRDVSSAIWRESKTGR